MQNVKEGAFKIMLINKYSHILFLQISKYRHNTPI